MKHTLIALLLIVSGYYAYPQATPPPEYKNPNDHRVFNDFPDSIRVEFPELSAIVVFELANFRKDNAALYTWSSALLELNNLLEHSIPSFSGKSSVSIHVTQRPGGQKEITINDAPIQTHIVVQGGEIIQRLPPGIELYIQTKTARIYVYIPTLAALPELARQDFLALNSDLQEESSRYYGNRKSIKARYIVQKGKIAYKNVQYAHPNDVIYLLAGAGAGVLRDRVYAELSGSLGLHFSNRFNRKNHRIELTYAAMYLPERTTDGVYENNISSFAGISYSRNFSKKGDRPIWTGLGGALLVHESGNFFPGKTAKLYILSDIGSTKLNLVPEFYLTDGFQKFLFGLKLNYTF